MMGTINMSDEVASMEFQTKGVKELIDSGIQSVPQHFVLPQHLRPDSSQVVRGHGIPVIDLGKLDGEDRTQTVKEIVEACQQWGFFQAVNHGVDEGVMEDMIKAGHAFHELPVEEKMKYHTEDKQKSRYSPNTLDKTKNKTVNWVDFFLMFSHLGFENFDEWPDVCREPGMEYCRGLRKMAERICGALSEGLGLPADYVQKAGLIDRQMLSLNYYPRCPDPNLALGVRDHSDPGTITILLQDQVAALQVSKEGRWVSVEPLVNAFVVNVGDQMEILSNGRFRSAEHRAVLTEVKVSRLSLPTFFNPRLEAKVTPILWDVDGEKKSSYYKECVFGDYLSNFFGKEYDSKSALEFVRLP